MSRPRVPSRRHLAPGGLIAGLALTGTALSLGAFQPDPVAAAPRAVAHAAALPSVVPVAHPQRASRGSARVALRPVRFVTRDVAVGRSFSGTASWYGGSFQGQRTASGERFDTHDLTAASRTLPFGTRLRVCRRSRCVVVRVNDRGPYVGSRVLDLSRAARDRLGHFGVARVTATPVESRRVAVRPPVRAHAVAPKALPVRPLAAVPAASTTSTRGASQGAEGVLALGAMLAGASGLTWLRRFRSS